MVHVTWINLNDASCPFWPDGSRWVYDSVKLLNRIMSQKDKGQFSLQNWSLFPHVLCNIRGILYFVKTWNYWIVLPFQISETLQRISGEDCSGFQCTPQLWSPVSRMSTKWFLPALWRLKQARKGSQQHPQELENFCYRTLLSRRMHGSKYSAEDISGFVGEMSMFLHNISL